MMTSQAFKIFSMAFLIFFTTRSVLGSELYKTTVKPKNEVTQVPWITNEFTCQDAFGYSPKFLLRKMANFFDFLNTVDFTHGSWKDSRTIWRDFEMLEKAIVALEENINMIERSSDAKEKLAIVLDFIFSNNQSFSFLKKLDNRNLVSKSESDRSSIARGELIASFDHQTNRLLSLLPMPYNNKIKIASTESKRIRLSEEAAETMSEQTDYFLTLFKKAGFSSLQNFVDFITGEESKDVTDIEQMRKELIAINHSEYEFAMRRPENSRFWLLNGSGFQNQRETNTSNGVLSTTRRDRAEANGLGISDQLYREVDNDIKPVYGFLSQPVMKSRIRGRFNPTQQYGSDLYFFKKEKVKSRLSFTFDDSLEILETDARSWKTVFIPWRYHPLISMSKLLLNPENSGKPHEFKVKQLDQKSSDYLELQFWGPLGLEHVEKLIFEGRPPTGKFLEKLRQFEIEIYDGRVFPPKLWKETI